jgi:NADH dehydrogenase/NADH:ubiquinone oxidoreductase subunit G
MTTQSRKEGGVNRLVDMVVEEVSLVDRAANNRQFLIVKRDPSMDEDTDIDKTGDESAAADTTESASGGSALDSALAALESLTSIVEALGELGANRADTRLAELARELKDTAEQILTQVGDEPPPTDELESTDDINAEGAEGASDPASSEAQAKAKGSSKGKTPGKAKGKTSPKPPSKKPRKDEEDGASDEETDEEELDAEELKAAKAVLTTSVAKLTEAVQSLTQSVTEQQQRLGRVEKQFGLPNSASPAEKVSKASDEAVGWPLDLNQPMDRQSIDKAVSFHEL